MSTTVAPPQKTSAHTPAFYEQTYDSQDERLLALLRDVRSGTVDKSHAMTIGRRLGFERESLQKLQAIEVGVTGYGGNLGNKEVRPKLGAESALFSRFLAKEWTATRPDGPFEGWDCEYMATDPKSGNRLVVLTRGNEVLLKGMDTKGRSTHRYIVGGKSPFQPFTPVGLADNFGHVLGGLPPEVLAKTSLRIEAHGGPEWEFSSTESSEPGGLPEHRYETKDEASGWTFQVTVKGDEGRIAFRGPMIREYAGTSVWGHLAFAGGGMREFVRFEDGPGDEIYPARHLLEKLPPGVKKLLGGYGGVR